MACGVKKEEDRAKRIRAEKTSKLSSMCRQTWEDFKRLHRLTKTGIVLQLIVASTKHPRFDDSQTLPRDSVMEVGGPQLQSGLVNGELMLLVEAVLATL